jgi:transcriptional regulator with XRE-family HTH domain
MESELGQALRARRKELGYSQMELAGRLDVRQATVSSIERGTPPDFGTLRKLARALQCRIVIAPEGIALERC